jgi:hypothetical protein
VACWKYCYTNGHRGILELLSHPGAVRTNDQRSAQPFMMVLVRHMYVSSVVQASSFQALPALSLFFAGLLIFLFNINHPVLGAVVWCVRFSAPVYACSTLLVQYNSPVLCAAPLNRMAPLCQYLICGHRSHTFPIHGRRSAGIHTPLAS